VVTLKIDKKEIKVPDGATVLEAARTAGVEIPTLCHNDALEPYGACRICLVEIDQNGRTVLEAACTMRAADGMEVKTETPLILKRRKVVVEMLLARCPEVEVLKRLADQLGVDQENLPYEKGNDDCILCGLCVRACNEVVGAKAIQFAGAGLDRKVSSPLEKSAEDCIACGSCAFVCPTGAVKKLDLEKAPGAVAEKGKELPPTRELAFWQVARDLQNCTKCGNPFAPVQQLNTIKQRFYLIAPVFNLCPTCRSYPKIDEEKCLGCGSCAESCPIGALELKDPGGYDKKSIVYEQNCMGCHTCEGMCPVQAIS
jgi:bidirectional [NiFe] hydrogenase diaphorase subunit